MYDDVVKVAPRSVKVLFENDSMRVLELKFRKGQKLATHSHPPNFVYAITAARFKSTSPESKTETVRMKKGESTWSDGSTHAVENLASTLLLQIELKR